MSTPVIECQPQTKSGPQPGETRQDETRLLMTGSAFLDPSPFTGDLVTHPSPEFGLPS